jgi:hypothetical protein
MKSFVLLIALCAVCEPAMAQTTRCQAIRKAGDRLACYDRAAPPTRKIRPAAASSTQPPPRDQAGDPLSAENAQLDAKINNICRGC